MAKAAANRAVELDTTLAEAYAALGWMRGLHEWDWAGAEEAFRRAMRLNPSYATAHQWYALMIAGLGRVDEALAELRLAQQLDPLSQAIAVDVARVLYYYRRHNDAAEELRKTLALHPDCARAHGILGAVQLAAGKPDEAIRSHQRAIELAGGWLQQRWGQPGLGYAYAVAGRRDDALRVLGELERERAARYERPESLGLVSLGLSRSDEALTWLEKAAEERSIYPLQLRDPVYDPVRAQPRFVALLRRLNVD
jgi:tetratricopeptide (TPR) repeat protein